MFAARLTVVPVDRVPVLLTSNLPLAVAKAILLIVFVPVKVNVDTPVLDKVPLPANAPA